MKDRSGRHARPIQLLLLDMDGVVFEGPNFWLDLHRLYGTEERGVELADRYVDTDYARLADLVANELWKDKPAEPLLRLVRERRYQPGVQDLVATLRERGLSTGIISSGPYRLAQRAQRELGIDVIRANRLGISAGRITGEVDVQVPDGEKASVGLQVIAELDASPRTTAFVGDSESDAALAELVGLAIAYDTESERLLDAADFVLSYGELSRVDAIIRSYESYAEPASVHLQT